MRKLMLLVVFAALVFAQDGKKEEAAAEPSEIEVSLDAGKPGDSARIGYSKARSLAIETSVPRFLFEIPEFRAEEPLFFRVALGETKGVPFYGALDKSGKTDHFDLLYLDRDRDLDLTNDGEPVEARLRKLFSTEQRLVEFLGVQLDLPYNRAGEESKEPYACVFFYLVDGKKRPLTLQVERDGWRQGTVELKDGNTYRLVMVDDDSDGQYTTGDSWTLRPESEELARMLGPDATRSMLFPSWSADQKWTIDVKSVDKGGQKLVLVQKPAKESEHDFFLRIAKQRQPPEEKALGIDPLRPKAAANHTVDWIEGRGVAYAQQIANSPNVQKPVLAFFASNANRFSVLMDKYSFRDREVVTLAKRFVCVKIDAANMKGDMQKLGVDRIPMIVFLTRKGEEIRRAGPGFLKPRNLADAMKDALR